MANRLAGETSPYLLQHRNNPVDWYPWGEEALARARSEDKPILLSIGYSACHWCHVMERESFEDPATAAVMNRGFVSIKVDREERPDLDSIYMSAVQQLTGSGGWPMTVFLTPDLKPFFGGTYFPPEPRHGMPGFVQVMEAVLDAYRNRREEVDRSAAQLTRAISAELSGARDASLDPSLLGEAVEGLRRAFDTDEGGFGGAPKFPQAMALDFLLRQHVASGDPDTMTMVELTLRKMSAGGIHDQLGGGFHRYATDGRWRVPHFEKMLYDQALLAPVYLHAYQLTGAVAYREVAEAVVDYVLRDLTSPEGGFHSAEDADSEGREGLFYTWAWDELVAALGKDVDIVAAYYGARPEGNWEGRNILHVAPGGRAVAAQQGLDDQDFGETLAAARQHLLEARDRRVRPARDEKVITAWNGLMLAALADAATVLGRPDYLDAARRNAELLTRRLYVGGRVSRTYRDGDARGSGYLEDHAALAHGLLALYQADFDVRWFDTAAEVAELMIDRFRDPDGGILFSTSGDHETLLYRPKDFDDNAVPAGNSLAAEVMLELGLLTGEERYLALADQLLAALAPSMAAHPLFFGRLLGVLAMRMGDPVEVALSGELRSPGARGLLDRVRAPYQPNKVVAAGPEGSRRPALLLDRTAQGAEAALYVCRGFVCGQPVTDPEAVAALLAAPGQPAPRGFQLL